MKQNGWNFDNSYLQLPPLFYSSVTLNKVAAPELVIYNEALAEELEIDAFAEELLPIFAGNELPDDAAKIAQAYAGHQFGYFNTLGDGRAMLVGEQVTSSGKRFDIQLKGSGRTPFSRNGDGRAALGPMLREYIVSEAMHALHIPTTRSLAVVTTGEPIYRYEQLQGAILTRVAASHLRVGTFQYAARYGELADVKALADYAIERHYPHLLTRENRYVAFLDEVIATQARLIAQWQLVGFIHGVMNTDNVTISGETIDYGPCAFMDAFDPDTVFSSIDRNGRYAYGNQPSIGGWNMARLAESMVPLLDEEEERANEIAQDLLKLYPTYFMQAFDAGMRQKLGLSNEEQGDRALAQGLMKLMMKYDADYTNTFRALTAKVRPSDSLFATAEFSEWEKQWQERLARQEISRADAFLLMDAVNPAVIARNHRVEDALAAAEQGDYSLLHKLVAILQKPYELAEENLAYSEPMGDDEGPYQTYCGT